MDYYIPVRKDRKDKKSKEIENSKTFVYEISNDEKEELLKNLLQNKKFQEMIKEIESGEENNKKLNLSQFNRFYSFLKEKEFDFFNKEMIDFIKKQKERNVANKFYDFVKTEFIKKVLEIDDNEKNEDSEIEKKIKKLETESRNEMSEKAKQKLDIIEKYLLYTFGKKKIEKIKYTKSEVE